MYTCVGEEGRVTNSYREEQQEMGLEGIGEEDKYLMAINLDDLETYSGEHQAYWLLSVKAAREAFLIRRQRAQAALAALAALRRGQNNHRLRWVYVYTLLQIILVFVYFACIQAY